MQVLCGNFHNDITAADRGVAEITIRNFSGIMCVVSGRTERLFTLRDVKEAIHATLGIDPRQQRLFSCSMELQLFHGGSGPSELRDSCVVNDIIDEDNAVDLQMVLRLPEQVEENEEIFKIQASSYMCQRMLAKLIVESEQVEGQQPFQAKKQQIGFPSPCSAELFKEVPDHVLVDVPNQLAGA
jgi:hypothetical protein